MRPYLELLTMEGEPFPLYSSWPAGVLGENGWTDGPPLRVIVHDIYDDVDGYVISITTYDGRDRRTDNYNAFSDPSGSGQIVTLDWVELIYKWTRFRPYTQNEGMHRSHIVLPPIGRGTTGQVKITFVGCPGKDAVGEQLPMETLQVIEFPVSRR